MPSAKLKSKGKPKIKENKYRLETLDDGDHNTTQEEYNLNKQRVRRHLASKTDPFPFVVASGAFREELATLATGERMRELAEAGEEVTLLRGYRLVTVANLEVDGVITYNGDSGLVIVRADGSKECLFRNRRFDDASPIVFVPSSRCHKDLTDEEITSGAYILCTVVDGPKDVLDCLMMARNCLSHFERRKLCASPEESLARKLLYTRRFPWYVSTQTRSPTQFPISRTVESF